jgi:hypothetical protein
MHQQVFQQIRNHRRKYLEILRIAEEVIQVIQKIVLQQRQYHHQNVHYIHHVLIVIVNNVHHFRIIENRWRILHQIHHRQIQRFIKRIFIVDLLNKNNHYQLVDLIHILNHYQKRQRRKLQYNERNLWQANDEDIYHVIVHFGLKHKHNRQLI